MEITYLGGVSHQISGDQTILVNPIEKPSAAVIPLFGARQKKGSHIVNGPGEYEIRDVLILTVAAGPLATSLAHQIDIDGVSVVHIDPPAERLTQAVLETLGRIDVLLVNVENLEAAQAAVRDLEPRVVLPFGPKAADLFAAMGITASVENRFVWKANTALPKALLLKPRPAKQRAA